MRSHLVGLQYAARRRRALDRYPHGESRIIVVEGAEAGWLFTATLPDMVWLVEILVLPEFRGRGAGSLAIRRLIGRAAPVPVRLNVNLSNTGAARLYRRLGFHALESDGVQLTMEFRP
jgi:ribosomal protein S18 acetylase RimI-like enzyme